MMKPRIRFYGFAWKCFDGENAGWGESPELAFYEYMERRLAFVKFQYAAMARELKKERG